MKRSIPKVPLRAEDGVLRGENFLLSHATLPDAAERLTNEEDERVMHKPTPLWKGKKYCQEKCVLMKRYIKRSDHIDCFSLLLLCMFGSFLLHVKTKNAEGRGPSALVSSVGVLPPPGRD